MSGPQKSFEEGLKGVRSKKGVPTNQPKKCHPVIYRKVQQEITKVSAADMHLVLHLHVVRM